LGRIESGSISPSANAADEGQGHAGRGDRDRRAADAADKTQIGFHSGQKKQHQDAELRYGIDHAFLLGRAGKQRVLKVRPYQAENRRTEQNAAKKLAHDGGLAEFLHDFAEPAANQQQKA
jgi:hypothetical protein